MSTHKGKKMIDKVKIKELVEDLKLMASTRHEVLNNPAIHWGAEEKKEDKYIRRVAYMNLSEITQDIWKEITLLAIPLDSLNKDRSTDIENLYLSDLEIYHIKESMTVRRYRKEIQHWREEGKMTVSREAELAEELENAIKLYLLRLEMEKEDVK